MMQLKMGRYTSLLLPLVFVVACEGESGGEPLRQDSEGRISYQLPAGWSAKKASNGTRFEREDFPRPRAEIQVNTVDLPRTGVEAQREAWLSAQRRAGFEVLHSADSESAGFEVVEYVHTAKFSYGKAVWHHALLAQGDFMVSTYLSAPEDLYEQHLPEYRSVLASIRPLTSAPVP